MDGWTTAKTQSPVCKTPLHSHGAGQLTIDANDAHTDPDRLSAALRESREEPHPTHRLLRTSDNPAILSFLVCGRGTVFLSGNICLG